MLTLNGVSSISTLSMTDGVLNGSGTVSVTSAFSQTGGSINKTGSLTINQAADALTLGDITASSLSLSATGTINANGAISAGTFTLNSGTWDQVSPSLPGFSATDFRIAGGTFLRATGGDGTSGNPYQLADIYGVQGMGSSGMLANSFTLANNVDASGTVNWNSGAGFVPIGTWFGTHFTGIFDGLSHTLSDLRINQPTTDFAGLFGAIDVSSMIRNVGLVHSSVTAGSWVGSLVGAMGGAASISNCYATTSVSGQNHIGGLVGDIADNGTVSNSYVTGNVTGSATNVGGLVGYKNGTIINSYATGNVSGSSNVGGLAGNIVSGTISGSYWNTQTNTGSAGFVSNSNLSSVEMMQMASFTGWSIAKTGGAGKIWRIYEGSTMPLLTSFLTPLTLTNASDASVTYNGSVQSGGATSRDVL